MKTYDVFMYAERKTGYIPFYHNELHSVGIGNTTPIKAVEYALDVFPKATILAIWEVSIGGRLIAQVPAEEYTPRNG